MFQIKWTDEIEWREAPYIKDEVDAQIAQMYSDGDDKNLQWLSVRQTPMKGEIWCNDYYSFIIVCVSLRRDTGLPDCVCTDKDEIWELNKFLSYFKRQDT